MQLEKTKSLYMIPKAILWTAISHPRNSKNNPNVGPTSIIFKLWQGLKQDFMG